MQDFSLFSRGIVKKDVTHVACLNVLVKGTTMCIYRKTVILSICAFPVSLYYWKILQFTTGVFNLWKTYPGESMITMLLQHCSIINTVTTC